MVYRKYRPSDCEKIAELFYQTVHSVNQKDYTPEQLDAWATGQVDLVQWNRTLSDHYTVVAEEDGVILGFGDIAEDGYLDRLYVHKDHQGQGIATALCDRLERTVGAQSIATYASITARPFFEKRGYQTVKPNQVERNGVRLTNYLMKKDF